MATNRYVGARYVPLFTGDWDNTKTYEPLSIVTYQGDSYTSKAYVPAGVAITNTTYWVKTANFNQQVADLDHRVDLAEGDIEALETAVSGIPDMFVIDYIERTLTNVPAGSSSSPMTPVDISKAGYKAIALAGFSCENLVTRGVMLGTSAQTLTYTVSNMSDETVSTAVLTVRILYVKESEA